jgi:DNA-binding XRE family transcriptional regulator
LPFSHGSIVAPKPPHPNRWKCTQSASTDPKTVGEHLKARRLAVHRFQSDVAKELGAEKTSLQNWERGIYEPIPRFYPAIIRFLGYVPFAHDGTFGGQTRWLRLCAGWTREEFAAVVPCRECTIWRWETNQPIDKRRWARGITAMTVRLDALGLSDFTASVVRALTNA